MHPAARALIAVLATASTACSRCDASAPSGAADGGTVEVDLPAASPLVWPALEPRSSPQGIGLPEPCRAELPWHEADFGERRVRFVAAPHALDELALVELGDGERAAARGVRTLPAGAPRELPWTVGAPPPLDVSARGWVAALTLPAADGERQAVLWREWGPALGLARGDQLVAEDVRCSGELCAVLSTLAQRTLGPGATLSFSDGAAPVAIEAPVDEAWRPLCIARLQASPARARVALTSPGKTALWEIADGRATRSEPLFDTPHGSYEVTDAPRSLVVAAGAPPDEPCVDHFPIVVHGGQGGPLTLRASGPPRGVFARAVGELTLVAWLAPAACRLTERTVVTAVVLDARGRPRSTPMTVSEAQGFAIATRGDRFALWLLRGRRVAWVTGRCAT